MVKQNRVSRTFAVTFLMLWLLASGRDYHNHEFTPPSDGSKQISAINVLLPLANCVDCRRVKYELSAYNGCYKWDISHPEIISIKPKIQKGDCVDTVVIEPATLKDHKNLIWITARDQNSGQVLRCEAKVSKINSITIESHYRQFYVNDNQHLHVAGYDEEGNIFSSLDGLRFDWSITSGQDKIKRIQVPSYSKQHSDTFFVKGTEAGQATVNVKILETGYEYIEDSTITVTVVEPFVLIPQKPVYIAPTSEFQFQLAHLNMDDEGIKKVPIKIPSPNFYWNVDNPLIGYIGEDGMFQSRVTEGQAEIVVVDQRMQNNTADGLINVVYPYRLEVKIKDITDSAKGQGADYFESLSFATSVLMGTDEELLSSSDSHILIEEHVYAVEMVLFDKDNHVITLTDNLMFESLNLDPKYVEVVSKNENASKFVFKTKTIESEQKKLQTLHKLKEIRSKSKTEEFKTLNVDRLTVDKELVITKPVKIQHPTDLILLPFLPTSIDGFGSGEIWNTHAIGGSGVYSWSITDPEIASVQGSAQVRSLAVGKTKLFVKDFKNFKNWDSIDVEVAVVHQLSWIEEQIELRAAKLAAAGSKFVSGESRVMSLFALDINGRKFTNCTAINPSFSLKEEGIVDFVDSPQNSLNEYDKVKQFIQSRDEKELLTLKQKFDENKNVVLASDLEEGSPMLSDLLMFHNNFGICAQKTVQAQQREGLGRVKAQVKVFSYLNGPGRLLESEFAEIAVYNEIKTVGPKHRDYLSDMYSVNQLGQEFQSFQSFYDDKVLNLNYGTQVTWVVVGGTNFWSDYAEKYQTSWEIESVDEAGKKQDQNLVEVTKASEQTTEFHLNVHCLAPSKNKLDRSYEVFVHLNQSSKQSRHLLRPASHHTQIEVHCEPPRSVRLLWTQQNRTHETHQGIIQALPRSRLFKNERTHYVLVNSQHYVRHLTLDHQHQVSLNQSSIATAVESSDPSMALVYLADGISYTHDIGSSRFDKRLVAFLNQTGTVTLSTQANSYFDAILNNKDFKQNQDLKRENTLRGDYKWSVSSGLTKFGSDLYDSLKVEIVRNVDIEPKYKSLYIGSQESAYKLKLLHGSGYFSVSLNDTSLADIVHKDREVLLYPKSVGGLEVRVEDLELPEAETASAEVLISDIARLTLWSPRTLIEQGDDMDLTVSAYDSFGVEFDADQYQFMNFEIETEMTGVLRQQGLITLPDSRDNTRFNAQGNEPGIYQLTAYTNRVVYGLDRLHQDREVSRSTLKIVSDMLRLEVFPLLEILPKQLLITPNMRYTLQIVGGPQSLSQAHQQDGSHIEIRFDIEETDIATVDQHREVTGHRVGDATLYYEIIQLRSQQFLQASSSSQQQVSRVVSKKTVPIRVRLVTDIEIPMAHQRQIYAGSYIKIAAVLKYGAEYFNHGIAPISYSWNCTQSRTLQLDLPSKQDLAEAHGVASNFVMTSKTIRDNLKRNNNVEFFTAFNSSSVYATAGKDGDALVHVQLAIEYPQEYNNEQNWFEISSTIKVTEKLTINVPEYSNPTAQQTHLYMLPPNTKSKIQTNKQTRLRLGYSQQSVYDYSTQSYKYQEYQGSNPIISLVGDEAIQTFDKYGKVTVIVEEGQAFSDQVVMLNVLIGDIYSITTLQAYDALSLPLGSSFSLPIHFQNEHAHRFASNIEGIKVGVVVSHPKVVQVKMDNYNQTMTLISQGSGDCNVVLYLEDHPHIFDVIRVRVSSIVKPLSPVYLHVGGTVDFVVASTDDAAQLDDSQKTRWSSSDPGVLQINHSNGKALGVSEGKVDVLLSNHANAASIVNVARVSYGQIDQSNGQLLVSTDEGGSTTYSGADELRVRVKLFLNKQTDEVMPTVQFDGITLIRQNVGIRCESEQPDFVEAHGEVSELEGYFCVVRYAQKGQTSAMPRFVKIFVSAYSQAPDQSTPLYSEQVTSFEVQLTSSIKIENRFKYGVSLNRAKRTESVLIFSSSDFQVQTDYLTPEESELIKYQVNREDQNSNQYNLTVTVPAQVNHDFQVNLILSHPYAKRTTTLPLTFSASDRQTIYQPKAAQVDDYSKFDEQHPGGIYGWLSSQEEQAKPQKVAPPQINANNQPRWSWKSYLLVMVAIVAVILYILIQICNVDLFGLWQDYRSGRMRDAGYGYRTGPQAYQPRGHYSQQGIREPKGYRKVPVDQSQFSTFRNSSFNSNPNQRRANTGMNLDRFDYSARRSPVDRSRTSIYSNLDDNSRYF